MRFLPAASLVLALTSTACGDGSGGMTPPRDGGGVAPSETCGSVRLTSYNAGDTGWCEFPRNANFLPAFVRSGVTGAIAEPWNGSSYGGAAGESCGECWEIDTINGTEVVMIADLCPIEGNPLCAGGHFHIDLANEAAEAVGGGANDEGSARRVPCPVSGNVHVRVNNRNPSYLRIAPMNHRIPIRSIDFRGAGDGVAADNPWTPVQRSGGAWHTVDAGELSRGGSGVVLRFTSAQGEVIESTTIIPTSGGNENVDLGVQFTDQDPSSGGACEFIPPAVVYGEEFGGIDEMRWIINPWGAAEAGPHGPYDQDCFAGSSCLRVRDLDQWTGFHLYYRQEFPSSTFSSLTLQARTESGTGMIQVTLSDAEGNRCTGTVFDITETYSQISIDVGSICGGVDRIASVTIDNPGPNIGLLLDDVRFSR
ncbi:MAG: hypothetical protein IPG17_03270 [Sandaracinaceae bacterium]|nr:hypothetical protein [Sandaracinaceae bacterium]